MQGDSSNDIFQAQPPRFPPPSSSSNKRLGKPPTRLQNRAPKPLDLDQVVVGSTPIPLLSPLVLSPAAASVPAHDHHEPSPAAVHDQFMFPAVSSASNEGGGEVHNNISTMASSGGYDAEPSSLFTFFQNQCVLVDQAPVKR